MLRLPNLTLLPIFNDEAIYLDWGWRMTTPNEDLYLSLQDNKQPLLMWVYGIFSRLLPDPLFTGRIISIITGLFTLIGIYFLSKKIFDQKIGILSSVLYILIPIFAFYDRQALMESSISAIGIWAAYTTYRLIETNKNKYAILTGIILGTGLMIKSSSAIFALTYTIIIFLHAFKNRKIYKNLFLPYPIAIGINLLVLINPQFWETLNKNVQYSLTLSELLSFPFNIWMNNILGNIEILFYFFTPIVFIFSIIGVFLVFRNKNHKHKFLLYWLLISLLILSLVTRNTSQRYIVSFIPLLTIFCSYFIFYFYKKKLLVTSLLSSSLLIPAFLLVLLISSPNRYISFGAQFTRHAEIGYLTNFTSGYGVDETLSFLYHEAAKKGSILVVTALNAGNPESSIHLYSSKKGAFTSGYLDTQIFPINTLDNIDCLQTIHPLYFISRDDQQAGLNKYFSKLQTFKNPYGQNSIGVFILKPNCIGKTLTLDPIK